MNDNEFDNAWKPPPETTLELTSVLQGQQWVSGTAFRDAATGAPRLWVRHQGHFGDVYDDREDPAGKFLAVLACPRSLQTAAVVCRLYGKMDFGIFCPHRPAYPGQSATRLLGCDGIFYLYGTVRKGGWNGLKVLYERVVEVTQQKKKKKNDKESTETVLQGKRVGDWKPGKEQGFIPKIQFAIDMGSASSKTSKKKNQTILHRSQSKATLMLRKDDTPNISLVEAVCVAYAFDRLTAIHTEETILIGKAVANKKTAKEAAEELADMFAEALDLSEAAHAALETSITIVQALGPLVLGV